ncbi:DinB family protein [Phycicoccus sp. CSK15P-2]|uniref:DinB family protein n=1 Tax=Phycicoccus sp. CSK15P-2 TaxID=2807627 RepID=UPI00194EDF4F|nr:DinB family protein [Phycicoccus sp. CSK15P-2]MBM6403418.1 DinB family protein [Phycicoccus sp. CSK15P-2]
MTDAAPDPVVPDTKDWTWTLERPCPECGFACAVIRAEALAGEVLSLTDAWPEVLERPDAGVRPEPATWSPLEYACHVRDVCRLFEQRLRLMLAEDDPAFDNWDQDRTAVEARYGEQDPAVVGSELADAAARWAQVLVGVVGDQWERTGRRSDGSRFTVRTLGQYGMHDLAHHLWDVGVARQ